MSLPYYLDSDLDQSGAVAAKPNYYFKNYVAHCIMLKLSRYRDLHASKLKWRYFRSGEAIAIFFNFAGQDLEGDTRQD